MALKELLNCENTLSLEIIYVVFLICLVSTCMSLLKCTITKASNTASLEGLLSSCCQR